MVRFFSPIFCRFCLFLTLSGFGAAAVQASGLPNGQAFQTLVAKDLGSGRITAEEALLLRFQFGFAPAELPGRYRVSGFSPLPCATELVSEYYSQRGHLTNDTINRIDGWLQPGLDKSLYLSPSGHFQLSYSLSGSNAVPAADSDPANGIPDFVERVARYCDRSWAVEVDSLGFTAPPGGVYDVSFEDMQYYGYTAVVDPALGVTRIVLHNTYAGFPENDDPEGNDLGAAKVTAAHEFKHATQYATSAWSEGGWNELDATWMEDVVYDQVNDYYNYLNGESPLRRPEIPLNGGANTTGSYEDCVWQTFLTEAWGMALMQDFWARRGILPLEGVMDTYQAVLADRGQTLAGAWAEFTAWNYGVGSRAVAGLGYQEGAAYPIGPLVDTAVQYPFATSGSVEHLAAQFVGLQGFDPGSGDLLRVVFSGQTGTGPLTLAVHVTRWDGSGVIEIVALDATNSADHLLSVPVREIQSAAVVVGNAATFGLAGDWDLDLSLVPIPAVPQPVAVPTAAGITLPLEANGQTTVRLTNAGEAGSLLTYDMQLWSTDPDSGRVPVVNKSVAGSSFVCKQTAYLAGQLMNLDFTVFNGSTDDEWLSDLSLDFPAGVTVLVSSNFSGGSLGDLVTDNSVGDGAVVSWHGVYGVQDYGVVRNGESASGTVQVMAQPGFVGSLDIGWTLTGDGYGTTPHQLGGMISLTEDSPVLTLQAPNGGEVYAVDDSFDVTWSTGGSVALVDLEFSRDGGQTWTTVAAAVPNSGSYSLVLSGPPSNTCLLRVIAAGGQSADTSNAFFTLYETPAWLTAETASGALAVDEYVDADLDFDTSGLGPGDYTAWLVWDHGPVVPHTVIPVQLTVASAVSMAPVQSAFVLRGARPNPFNPRTRIAFELPGTAVTTIDVLDVRGRRVRRLFLGTLGAGAHEQVWDGRDDRGQAVGAGVYLVRVRAGAHTGTTKILLAK